MRRILTGLNHVIEETSAIGCRMVIAKPPTAVDRSGLRPSLCRNDLMHPDLPRLRTADASSTTSEDALGRGVG